MGRWWTIGRGGGERDAKLANRNARSIIRFARSPFNLLVGKRLYPIVQNEHCEH
jgi:hypothetical protein